MSVQTTVSTPAVTSPGQLYDSGFSDKVTKICTTAVPFGAFVYFGGEGTCRVPAVTGDVTGAAGGGIALIDKSKASGVGYIIGDAVTVLVKGRCGALNEETLAIGDTLMARFTAAGNEQLGAQRNDTDSGDAVAIPGIKVFQGGGINLAVLQVG